MATRGRSFASQYTLIEKEEADEERFRQPSLERDGRQYQIGLPAAIVVFAAQLILCAVLVVYLLRSNVPKCSLLPPLDDRLHDDKGNSYPAAEAVRYVMTDFLEDAQYMTLEGVPSAETDAAWEGLMEQVTATEGTIQASHETGFEIKRLPATNVSDVDPRQHLYGLDMFHQLHCLNRIRKSFHPEHYFPGESEARIRYHKDHCLDHLRQSVMCAGDFALDYWRYDVETDRNWLRMDVPHVCRDFNSLSEWVKKHRYRRESWIRPKAEHEQER